jgi:hypothetical protein
MYEADQPAPMRRRVMAAWLKNLVRGVRLLVAMLSVIATSGEDGFKPSFALLMASARAALAVGSI